MTDRRSPGGMVGPEPNLASSVAHQLRQEKPARGKSGRQSSLGGLVARAAAHLDHGEHQAVIDLVRRELREVPTQDLVGRDAAWVGSAYVLLARACAASGRQEEASAAASGAVKAFDRAGHDLTPAQRIDLGRALVLVDEPDRAARALEQGVEEQGVVPVDVLLLLAETLDRAGEADRAIEAAERAVREDPRADEAVEALARHYTQRGDDQPEVGAAVAAAQALVDQGDNSAALAWVDRAVGWSPASGPLLVYRAALLDEEGRAEEALDLIEQALDLDATNATGLAVRADLLLRRPDLDPQADAAAESVARAADLDPVNVFVLNTASHVHRRRGALDLAGHFVEQALALDPVNVSSLVQSAQLLLERDEPANAQDVLSRAAALSPTDATVQALLGTALARQGRGEEALAHFDHALELKPTYAWAAASKADQLKELGRWEEAATWYERLLELEPDNGPAPALLAWTCWLSDSPDVDMHVDRALAADPDSALALRVQAQRALERGAWDEALAIAEHALQVDPEDTLSMAAVGWALAVQGRSEEGLTHLDRCVALLPDYPYVHAYRGYALNALSRGDEALAAYDRALELKPDLVFALQNRGSILVSRGEPERGLVDLDQALTMTPGDAFVCRIRSEALQELGRGQEAVDALDAGLSQNPWDSELLVARAELLRSLERYDEALEAADDYLRTPGLPDSAQVLAVKGDALVNLLRPQEALVNLDEALALQPDYAFVLTSRGFALRALHQHRAALESVDRALALVDPWWWGVAERSLLLAEVADFQGSLEAADRLLEQDPSNSWAWGRRGIALLNLGQPHLELSREAFQRAGDLMPDEVGWLTGLGEAEHALGDEAAARSAFARVVELLGQKDDMDDDDRAISGWSSYRLGDADTACRLLRRVVASGVDDLIIRCNLALAFLSAGQVDTGTIEYERAIDAVRTHADASRARAVGLEAAHDLRDGIASGLVRDDPQCHEVLELLDQLAVVETQSRTATT